EAESGSQAGIDIPFVTLVVAGAGLFMILFLTANGIAESVRERIPEFAMLKTLGFSDFLVMALVFVETAIPCVLGAAVGLGLATAFVQKIPELMPPNVFLPVPRMSVWVLGMAMISAVLVALVSAAFPVIRLRRLDIAAALTRT
ncbi:MAG TPA: ABC transporter permease, partial [Rhizomicrobium sp.]|nr:ABC transporter permease [Rhizomicrobium sp.]